MNYALTGIVAAIGGVVIILLIAAIVTAGKWVWRVTRPQAQQPTQQPAGAAGAAAGTPPKKFWVRVWEKTTLGRVLGWIVSIWLLIIAWPWVVPLVWEIPQASYRAKMQTTAQPVVPKPHPWTENKTRYEFFVDTPRKFGWKVLPMEVDLHIPLDGKPRYSGLNVAFLAGSRVTIECPGYKSGGKVKLFAKADDEDFVHLGNKKTFRLQETGSVTGGEAILVKGEKTGRYEATSNRIKINASPLPGHHRIATTKVCETGMGIAYDWGRVQFGSKADSPPWRLYIRFADVNGITLSPDVMQQKPGQVMLGVMEKGKLRPVFTEIVSKAANVYTSSDVPSSEENAMLRIQTPNLPEGRMIVEVILDIDTTQ